MNEIIVNQQNLSSLEVAEMVEKEHKYLMRDIRRYSNVMTGANISPVDFWKEGKYTDNKGEERPCYNITKKGCEFIAHKITGTKGTIFTARYINRFHEMEDVIVNGIQQTDSKVPMIQAKSTTPIPLVHKSDWYSKNEGMIYTVLVNLNMTHKELYRVILTNISKVYDVNAAREIYRKEVGYYPVYAIDIVSYFPQLENMANNILQSYYGIAIS